MGALDMRGWHRLWLIETEHHNAKKAHTHTDAVMQFLNIGFDREFVFCLFSPVTMPQG